MGTPEFAVPSLEVLIKAGYDIPAVVTVPDKPKGRGQKLSCSAVKECALKHNIPVLQPIKLNDPEFLVQIEKLNPDLQIVVAFRILPKSLYSLPKQGTFNLHGSLLPQYRGAAPINWAIMNGEKETGLTTFFLDKTVDTGEIILQSKEEIKENDTVGDLYSRLMLQGADLVLQTVEAIEKGSIKPFTQKESNDLKAAPKIFKEDCLVDFNKSNEEVYNFIRGLSPYPAAHTEIKEKKYKLFSVEKLKSEELLEKEESNKSEHSEFKTDNKNYLWLKTKDGYIDIKELQVQGKKRMNIKDFLRGNKL